MFLFTLKSNNDRKRNDKKKQRTDTKNEAKKIKIIIKCLDLVPANKPVVMKIDIEGYECEVIDISILHNTVKSRVIKTYELLN